MKAESLADIKIKSKCTSRYNFRDEILIDINILFKILIIEKIMILSIKNLTCNEIINNFFI